MSINVIGVNYYLPQRIKRLNQTYQDYGLSANQMHIYTRFYGLDAIRFADISMQAMLVKVASPLVTTVNQDKIRYLISPRTTPVVSPFALSLVRNTANSLQLTNAIPMAISMNKCASVLRTFELVKCLLQHDEYALMIIAESVFTEQNRVLPNITITSDAAAAVLINKNEQANNKLIALKITINGKYAKGVWMPIEEVAEFGKLFNQTMLRVMKAALQQSNLTFSQIKLIFPHNVNVQCWRTFANYAGILAKKIFLDNIAITAHCFNADPLINLATAIDNKLLTKGDYYMMATVGVGAVFGVAIFQY